MKICVVLSGDEQMATAGVRIRYQRIGARLATLGHSLTLAGIDSIKAGPKPAHDAYLICKCYDARSIVLAAELKSLGAQVGADFFDDYYTHTGDSRFVHLRQWLRDIGGHLTFVLSSTPLMRDNLKGLLPHLPCHLMNDPYEALDTARLAKPLARKLALAQTTGFIDIGWFGVGDNPYFPVGLTDLKAFGSVLSGFTAVGLKPRLSIITNRRALTVEGLEMLAQLPVAVRIEEWSEAAEREQVMHSFVSFLPVNAQRFSAVKSLNRAVTALTGGAQVLSTGYPLYQPLDALVYRDAAALAADIRRGQPRLRAETLPLLHEMMEHHANPQHEAAGFAEFLHALPKVEPRAIPGFAVVHGRQSAATIHKYALKYGHLSVGGPKPNADLNYDVKLDRHPETGAAMVLLSPVAAQKLRPELSRLASPILMSSGKTFSFIPMSAGPLRGLELPFAADLDFDIAFLAGYAANIAALQRLLDRLFGDIAIVISEQISPYWSGAAQPPERNAA